MVILKSEGRTWLVVDSFGSRRLKASRHAIMQRTGLPARDVRNLETLIMHESSMIMGREQAIVVNLGSIRAIIMAHEMLLINFTNPLLAPVIEELKARLCVLAQSSDDEDLALAMRQQTISDVKSDVSTRGQSSLPFEFRALEVCLEEAGSSLDKECHGLEEQVYPALDELATGISTLTLKRVRLLKGRLVTLSARVQKVRDELEKLLDNDDDMAEMYLTRREEDLASISSDTLEPVEEEEEVAEDDLDRRGDVEEYMEAPTALRRDDPLSLSSRSRIRKRDVEELEMLLEAYFVQLEGTLNRLITLKDYVDDTEDYISIKLDDKQNNLLQMGVLMTTASLGLGAFNTITGIFGMNIEISLFHRGTTKEFLGIIFGSLVGAVFMYFAVIGWCKRKNLLIY